MDAHAVPVLALFEKKMRLEVPLFQRQYVWSQEHQWEPLWEDISRKFIESLEGRKDAPVHFLGAMVLDQKQTPSTHVEKRQVIDGQQRLTTLQIFIAAFRDVCRENGCEELGRECDGFTENRGMMADPDVDRFKVWPTLLDRKQFSDVITAGSRVELEKRHPVVRRPYQRKPDPRPRMIDAYIFFHGELTSFFLGTAGDAAFLSEVPLNVRLDECFQALKNTLQVVTIDLQTGDDAQVIFETLNARGEPLLPADLLRNYIFLRAARAGDDQEALYKNYWQRFEDPFWRQEVKQGRLLRPRSDLFMQHFLAAKLGEDIPVKHLFVEYKNWIDRSRPYESVEEELAALAAGRENFRRIIEPKTGDSVYQIASFLDAFDIRTAYPLLLTLLERSDLSPEEWSAINVILESYLTRRAVLGWSTKNYNRVFLQLSRSMRRDGVDAVNALKQLASQSGESAGWPTDDAFRKAWLERPLYELGNQRLVYILGRLNQTFMSSKSEPLLFSTQPSVEHLMPQKWTEHWLLSNGCKGLTETDLLIADNDDPNAALSETRHQAVHRIGNLTLLMQPLNTGQSNAAWSTKKPEMLKHSLLPLNQHLVSAEAWNEAAIQARGEELLERALGIWPGSRSLLSRLVEEKVTG
jgi:uncharacterized protein with ParB-like and HNH nuclease domain